MDIASNLRVTRCILENDWKGLEDYIMSKTPEALTSNIITNYNILDHIVASDAPATLLETFLSKVPPTLLQKMLTDGSFFFAVGRGKKNIIEILVRYNTDLPNSREIGILPIHHAARLGRRDAVHYLLSNTTASLDGGDGITLLRLLINSNLIGKYYKGAPYITIFTIRESLFH